MSLPQFSSKKPALEQSHDPYTSDYILFFKPPHSIKSHVLINEPNYKEIT